MAALRDSETNVDPRYFSFDLGAGRVSGRGAESPFVVGALSGIHTIVVRSYL
jgi:hypothetical protein